MSFTRLLAVTAAVALLVGSAGAQEVDDALAGVASGNQAERRSQEAIDEVVDETKAVVREYSAILKEVEGLEVYRSILEKEVESQQREIVDLEESIDRVSVIERQVLPLMMRMVEGLEQFVELDVPFLLDERRRRVSFLKSLLERSDVTVAEKFRRVLEAFEIENDYGRTIEAYKGSLELDGATREVDFLRIGRVALLYQTADGEVYGMWDQAQRAWVPLSSEYRSQIRAGLRIARKQIAPDLLMLPIPAPEAAE
jgi:hypothetical protein